ncbi:hypothetical protein DNTS_003994 [Danionella cerebrum]|uniref:THD domain-containing protein n=1 Tax=Danionella cerebrum TaxID=2873325 RepID=A0A553RAX2_9TELE|nr:hypothetical protein DNTS_003994 [Danionella translucida]
MEKVRVIWATTASLLLLLTTSSLVYFFFSNGTRCQRVDFVDVSSMGSLFRRQVPKQQWLLKAYNHTDENRLMWEHEWDSHSHSEMSLVNSTWIAVQKQGVYLIYIQANYALNKPVTSDQTVELRLLLDFFYGENIELFTAAHDSRVVSDVSSDAMLSTFFLMNMQASNRFSVRAIPSDQLMYDPRPFSTFITMVKLADDL